MGSFSAKKLVLVSLSFALATAGCSGKNGNSQNYPLLTPPVEAATPAGLSGSSAMLKTSLYDLFKGPHILSLDIANFQNRFFSNGPTDLFGILSAIDQRISGLDQVGNSSCPTQTPVAVPLNIWGQTVTLQLQCYQSIGSNFTGDPGLVEWGQDSNGVFYLYTAIGAGWTAAIATPLSGGTKAVQGGSAANFIVDAWSSVGVGNGVGSGGGSCGTAWDDCSYGVMQIHADPSKPSFEMTVAGLGVGFCGAQIYSDNTDIFGDGDQDGTGNVVDNVCVQAGNLSQSVSSGCTVSASNFTLPPLWLQAGSGPDVGSFPTCAYPASTAGASQITLNGTPTDSVHFGPTTPAAGVGNSAN